MPNTNDTIAELQRLVVERVDERDWSGVQTLLDAIIAVDTTVTVSLTNPHPLVDPTSLVPAPAPDTPPKTDNPDEDSEWQRRFGG